VIVAPGQAYSMRDELVSPLQRLAEVLERRSVEEKKARILCAGKGGEAMTMLCGRFLLEESGLNPLARSLRPVLIVKRESDACESLHSAFRVMEAESSSGRPGAEAIISRLMDVIFLQAVRSSFETDHNHKPSWVGALLDPVIGKSIVTIHNRLNDSLSVDILASESGMSRSSFAAHFAQLCGEPPMTYVARWRMNRAAHLLRATHEKIAVVASRVGYDSVPALTKVFKKYLGVSPGAYRHQLLAANVTSAPSQTV
jgi:AraC-like DNA-binding protein